MNKELTGNLAWATGIVALALAASFARSRGLIDPETTTRIVIGATGLMIAWFGNQMPKRFVPSQQAREVHRVAGWSMAVSGLIYAVLWAFAPFDVALWLGCGAVAVGMIITVGYCLSLRGRRPAT